MARRAQIFACAILALTCVRCSLLLYNDDLSSEPAATDAGADASSLDASDATSDVALADAAADTDAGKTSFPSGATVWSGNGHAYEVVVVAGATYDVARLNAENRGGHLATIGSAEENAFVFTLAGAKPTAWRTTGEGDLLGPCSARSAWVTRARRSDGSG